MISLYPKRMFGTNGVAYDVAAHSIPLMLNRGGWKFLTTLFEAMGMEVPHVLATVVDDIENEVLQKALRQATTKFKNRVVLLKKMRSNQYLKNKKGLEHGKKVRKHDGDNSVGPSKRRKRRCGICLKLKGIETTAHSTGKKCPYYEEYQEMQKQKS